jgi:toxin ParE1/3/4
MRTRLASVAERLLDQPMMGRPGKADGTREFAIARTPYILIYRVNAEVLEVLRVIHGAQQWPPS